MPDIGSTSFGIAFSHYSLPNGTIMSQFELAQINIARFALPKEHAANAPFMAALDDVNAKAEASPGFVWRLVGEGNNATDVEAVPDDPLLIVNMSVWRDIASLGAFAYRNSKHLSVMRRKHEWFEPMEVSFALWWVPQGHRPSVADGMARLAVLASRGPSTEAFTFRTPFAAPCGSIDVASHPERL
ncbi:MAG: DUF3291 domain-containing protein [Micropepsaceae bacterium]